MGTPAEIFDAIAPNLASDPQKQVFLDLATDRTSSSVFEGNRYNLAVALRAAHMMALRDRGAGGEGGAITSKREGDLAVSYASGSGVDEDLEQTQFGKQLRGLIKGNVVGAGVTEAGE